MADDRPLLPVLLSLPIVGAVAWVALTGGPVSTPFVAQLGLLALLYGAAGIFAWRERASARLNALWVTGTACHLYFVGATALFGVHLLGVLTQPLRGADFTYDYRFYSLLLLGGIAVAHGTIGAGGTPGVVRGERPALARCTREALWLVAINLPLMPLQGFAVAFTIGGISALLLLIWTRSVLGESND